MTPDVSVLLPYRQAASTLDEALESMLAQRGVSLELIAIDDGSQDDGPVRVARAAARHHSVVPLQTGGVGIARALEIGRRAARAPLLARMDADDVCDPDRLRQQVEVMRADPRLGALGTRVNAFPVEAVGDGLRRYVAWQNGLTTAADHARQLFVESPLCHPSVMLRQDAMAQVGGWREGPFAEDYDLWLRLDAQGWHLAKLPTVLLGWRHQVGRLTFSDPRYGLDRMRALKAPYLARRLRPLTRPLAVWGAGPTGKRLARALEQEGLVIERFVDIDPRKIGRPARGVPIVEPERLRRGDHTVIVAVGAAGARDLIRGRLDEQGFIEGEDYLCAA